MADAPNLTIITATLNRLPLLKRAIASVDDDHVEHIVVDGESSDGTMAWLQQQSAIHAISDPAPGMYAALNRGLQLATGDWILLLNSDDALMPGALASIRAALASLNGNESNGDICYHSLCGRASLVEDPESMPLNALLRKTPLLEYDLDEILELSPWALTFGPTIINARVIHRSLYKRLGGFNSQLSIAADREFMIRARLAGLRTQDLHTPVYRYTHHKGSLTLNEDARWQQATRSEQLTIASALLKERIPGNCNDEQELKRWLKRWQATELLINLAVHSRRFNLPQVWQTLASGSRCNPGWPLQLLQEFWRRKGDTHTERNRYRLR